MALVGLGISGLRAGAQGMVALLKKVDYSTLFTHARAALSDLMRRNI
jgi:hypothetical protein